MATIHSSLPSVDDFISIEDEDLLIVAVDLEESIWTCINRDGNRIEMWHFDENGNAGIVHINNIRWDMIDECSEHEDTEY